MRPDFCPAERQAEKIMPEWLLGILLFWPILVCWSLGLVAAFSNTHLAMIFFAIGFFGEPLHLFILLFLFGRPGDDC